MTTFDEELKCDRLLNEIKQRHQSRDVIDVDDEMTKVVIFTCGNALYAFYGAEIREIIPASGIFWVPGLPEYLPGLINVRGDIESVIDIRHFLGIRKSEPEKCLVAMAIQGEFRSGILVDSIEDVVDIPLNSIKPPLATLGGVARDLVAGEFDHARGVITLLDVEKLAARLTP
ncbi:MAG: purine-binding chemotaxis protein CheW [Desulfuromonadales bacterium]|nr:purine-binding chemotaxis protein CheW [Desulfuromonadales bacterium]